MQYFIDTEFIDAGWESPVELLSIGVVAEDGREFYAINAYADTTKANGWVRENVLPFLDDPVHTHPHHWIRAELLKFVGDDPAPEFWGWCCGYDYVLVSQLIGFGNWPAHWPYYFGDIQQVADERGIPLTGEVRDDTHNALADAREVKALAFDLAIGAVI